MSLQVWLPLNGDLHNQGLTTALVTNYGASIDNSGKIGKCYSFDGVDDYLQITGFDPGGWTEFSIAFWVYPISGLTGVFLIRNSSATHQLRIQDTTFMFRDSNNSSQRATTFSALPTNTWSHLACVYNRGETFIYQNGGLAAHSTTYQNSGSKLNANLNEIRIGREQSSSGSIYFEGKVNDIRIYNHALSQKEVEELAKGLVVHYKMDSVLNGKVYDCSGFGNDATVVSTLTLPTNTARYDNSIQFNGTSSYLKTTPFYFNVNTWTVSLWYYKASAPTNYETLICLSKNAGADADKKFAIMPSAYGVWIKKEDGAKTYGYCRLNKWTHLVLTSTGKLYENGVQVDTISSSSTLIDCYDLLIGARPNAVNVASVTRFYGGNISDVRIYSTILTEAQVLDLYETSATIDKNGNGYAREIVEDNDKSSINKKGQFYINEVLDNDTYTTASITKTDKELKVNTYYEY